MKTLLNFEDKTTKELLSILDFEFFLKQNIDKEEYSKENVNEIYDSYAINRRKIKTESQKSKKQFFYYSEGQIRKMFTGGFLPALFELDESRSHTIVDFKAVGESWAYFEYWSNSFRKRKRNEKLWEYVVKLGSILAFILTGLKLIEILTE